VTLTPTDTTDYNTATGTVTITVVKVTPTISWATPAPITYGTALSGTQLNASSTTAGAFVYTPASGTVLTAGSQNLSVTFTPADTTDYTTATGSVTVTVNQATTPTITALPTARAIMDNSHDGAHDRDAERERDLYAFRHYRLRHGDRISDRDGEPGYAHGDGVADGKRDHFGRETVTVDADRRYGFGQRDDGERHVCLYNSGSDAECGDRYRECNL
jgi:hypothetical protein